jgi:hypothetical protein
VLARAANDDLFESHVERGSPQARPPYSAENTPKVTYQHSKAGAKGSRWLRARENRAGFDRLSAEVDLYRQT